MKKLLFILPILVGLTACCQNKIIIRVGVDSALMDVDSIWRTPGVDTIYWSKKGTTHAILDSTGVSTDTYVNAATFTGTTLTLTRNDGGTVTTTIPTSTDTYLSSASYTSGGTLTLTLNSGATVTTTISAGSTYYFGNGVTDSSGTVVLGGTLWKNTTIDATNTYKLTITGARTLSNNFTLEVNNTSATGSAISANASGSGYAVQGVSSSGRGIYGQSTSGMGGYFQTSSGTGLVAFASSGTGFNLSHNPTSTNTMTTIGIFARGTSGTAASGLGGDVEWQLETSTGANSIAGSLGFKWTDATNGSTDGQFVLKTVAAGGTNTTRLIIDTIPTYADDTAAGAGGLATGTMYKTSTGVLMIKL